MQDVPSNVKHPANSDKAVVSERTECEPKEECAVADFPEAKSASEVYEASSSYHQRAELLTCRLLE